MAIVEVDGFQFLDNDAITIEQERIDEYVEYMRNGKTDSYGMKYYSSEMKPDSEYFTEKMICK